MQYFQCRLFLQLVSSDSWHESGAIVFEDPDPDAIVAALDWREGPEHPDAFVHEPIRIAREHLDRTVSRLNTAFATSRQRRPGLRDPRTTT